MKTLLYEYVDVADDLRQDKRKVRRKGSTTNRILYSAYDITNWRWKVASWRWNGHFDVHVTLLVGDRSTEKLSRE